MMIDFAAPPRQTAHETEISTLHAENRKLREENAHLRHDVRRLRDQIAEHESRPGVPLSGMAPCIAGFTDEEFARMQIGLPFEPRQGARP